MNEDSPRDARLTETAQAIHADNLHLLARLDADDCNPGIELDCTLNGAQEHIFAFFEALAAYRHGEVPWRRVSFMIDSTNALVRYLVGDLVRAVKETVAETSDEKAKKRILQIVADAGSGGISRNELTRKTQFIRKSFRDEYLADLIESGELVMTTGARGMEIYRIGN